MARIFYTPTRFDILAPDTDIRYGITGRRECGGCSARYWDDITHYYYVSESVIMGFCCDECATGYIHAHSSFNPRELQANLDYTRDTRDIRGYGSSRSMPTLWIGLLRYQAYRKFMTGNYYE